MARPRTAREEVVERIQPPPRPPWYRDVWPWLLVLGLVVLGGIGALVGWQAYEDDDSDGSPQAVTTTGTTVVTQTTTVEEEPQPTDVPDVVGLNHVEAGRTIEAEGLAADSYPVPSDDDPGTVVSQNPDGGTQLNEGQIVRLNVSQGRVPPETRELPDVTGPQASDAFVGR